MLRRIDPGEPGRVGLAAGGELQGKFITERTQRRRVEPGPIQLFEVEVMVEVVRVPERQFGVVSPAVRFAGEESDPLGGGRLAHEGRKIRRQRRQRELVDNAMAGVVPRAT